MKTLIVSFIAIMLSISTVAQNAALSLESIWSGYFDQKDIQPHILNTKPAVAFIRADKATNFEGILTLDMVTGKIIDTIFTNQTKVEDNGTPTTFAFFEDFEFSPDDTKILIKADKESIYHTSHKEFVYIWDDVKKTLKPVSTDGKISYATFSSNGKYLSYVRDANFFIRNLENDKTTIVTTDGASGSIINGMADEVYEDGFGLDKMYQWNPQGTKVAFIKLNQGIVKKYPITKYERNEPVVAQLVFAKPGEAISEAAVYVYDIKDNSFVKLDLGGNANQYIVNFKWQQNGETIFVERLSRSQKKLDILQCNAANGNYITTVYSEEKKDYVQVYKDNMMMHQNTNSFYWLSEKDGYSHIYEVNYKVKAAKQLTTGNWEVQDFIGVDSATQRIYFMANANNTTQKHLYSVDLYGRDMQKITNDRGWHDVWLSKDYRYFFDKATTINSPAIYKIFKTNGAEITNKAIIENKIFAERIKSFDVNEAKMFQFANSGGEKINGWIIEPNKNFGGNRPFLLFVYGASNRQDVTEQWNDRMAMTYRYFANKGYIVASIDPSGTPGRGELFKKASYNRLADTAMADLTDAKNFLVKKYNADAKKNALIGWSYGGFLTTMAATKYSGIFHKYIAIAPVTNWRNYNAAYTERILQMPSDNPELYKDLKPEEHVKNYEGGLLLVHGSTDDNVHVEHTMRLAKALTDSDTYYDIQIFTDKGHNLSDGPVDKTRMNLFRKVAQFLARPLTNN